MASPAATDPGGGFTVTVPDLASASAAFARQHDVAARAVTDASGALAATSGMGGDDSTLAVWRGRYDAVAAMTWLAAGAMAASQHGIAVLLVDTADAYLAADREASPRRSGEPERLPRPPASSGLPPGPPPSTGPTDDGVPDAPEFLPRADPARLRSAEAAWTALAERLDDTAYAADSAFRTLIRHNHGATFSAMAGFWSRRFAPDAFDPLYNAVPRTARIIGQVCRELADLVEQTRRDVLNAAVDAAHDTAGAEILARLPARNPMLTGLQLVGLLAPVLVTGGYITMARDSYLQGLHELTERLGPDLENRLRGALSTEVPPKGDDPRPDDQVGVRAADVGEILMTDLRGSGWDDVDGPRPDPDQIHVTPRKRVHILDGDDTGGGHRPGAGIPGKSEFPPGWSNRRIIAAVLSVARDPDPDSYVEPDEDDEEMDEEDNVMVEGVRDGIRIRVYLKPDGSVQTGFPLDGPGVMTNPR